MEMDLIVQNCKAGDKDAFRLLFSTVERKSLHTAFLICKDHSLAEDILQETYIDCFKHIQQLKNSSAFQGWFYRILIRNSWKLVKNHRKLNLCSIQEHDYSMGSTDTAVQSSNDEKLISNELKNLILTGIDKMSPKVKTALILHYYNELSIDKISKIQGCLPATVKSRLYYGRQQLRRQLTPYVNTDEHISNSLIQQEVQ